MYANLTNEQLQHALQELKSELLLNKTNLSSTKRKKISVWDKRASAHAVGAVGIVFLTTFLLFIVSADASVLFKYYRQTEMN